MRDKENRRELRGKLIRAGNMEEVRAILGPNAKKAEIDRAWREIEAHRPAEGLETVDDDELEAVSGGNIFTRPFDPPDRDYEKDGCAASVEYGSWCGSDDACTIYDVTYANKENACLIGVKGHDWGAPWQEMVDRGIYRTSKKCKRCGKVVNC